MLNQFTAPLWGDEGFSAILSMHSLPDIIRIVINDTSPPLWNITEWIVFKTLGTDEIYIRLLAFFYLLVAVFFTFKIGSLLWDRTTGILAAALTFLNPFFFTYGFEGRMYSIMSAGVAGSMYFFMAMLFKKERSVKEKALHLTGYIVMTLWALYSHHFAMFIVFVQGLWFLQMLFTKNKAAKQIFIGFVGVGIGYLPWSLVLYNQIMMVSGGFWLGTPKFVDLTALVLEYLGYGIKHFLSFPVLVIVATTLALRKWNKEPKEALFLLSWFLIPILAAFTISQFFQSVFFNRYLLYTIPAAMLLVASNQRAFSRVLIVTILIIFAVVDFHYFTHPTKLPFPSLASYVTETKQKGDLLINWNGASHHLWETKYYGIPAPIYNPSKNTLPYFVGTALMKKGDIINQIPRTAVRVGVITSGPIEDVKLPGYTVEVTKSFDELKFIWLLKSN